MLSDLTRTGVALLAVACMLFCCLSEGKADEDISVNSVGPKWTLHSAALTVTLDLGKRSLRQEARERGMSMRS